MSVWEEKCIISPSLICLDMCNLESQIRILEQSGIQVLHVDILDGHFSPSMPLGLDTVRQLRQKTDMFFDCHVMVENQDFFVDELLDIGVQQIVFHAETQPHIDGMINRIHAKGVKAGIALKPSTPLSGPAGLTYVVNPFARRMASTIFAKPCPLVFWIIRFVITPKASFSISRASSSSCDSCGVIWGAFFPCFWAWITAFMRSSCLIRQMVINAPKEYKMSWSKAVRGMSQANQST